MSGRAVNTICDSRSGEEICDEGLPPSVLVRRLAFQREPMAFRNVEPSPETAPQAITRRLVSYGVGAKHEIAKPSKSERVQKEYASIVTNAMPFVLALECDDGEESVSHTDFTHNTGGWQGGAFTAGMNVLNASTPTISQTFSDLQRGTFTLRVRRSTVTSGTTIVVALYDTNGATISEETFSATPTRYTVSGTVPDNGIIHAVVTATNDTDADFELVIREALACQTVPALCYGVRNVQAVIKWVGTPRQPVNLFEAFVRYKIRSKVDETLISYVYQRPTSIGHLSGDTCDFWKQEGEGGFASDEVLIGTMTDPRNIDTDLINISDTNWLWSIPNGGSIQDELYISFPDPTEVLASTRTSGDECAEECVVEAIDFMVLANKIDNTGTDITGDEGCGPDPGSRLTIYLRYTNAANRQRQFSTNVWLADLHSEEADTAGWDTDTGIEHGISGDVARWETFEFVLDNPAGAGLDQCSEVTTFEAIGSGDITLPDFSIRTTGGFVKEPCIATVPVTTIVDGGIVNTIQSITLPSPAFATGYIVAMTKDDVYDSAFVQWDAPASVLKTAVGSLLDLGEENIIATGTGTEADPFVVEFAGIWSGIAIPLLEVTVAGDSGVLVSKSIDGYIASQPYQFVDEFVESTFPVYLEDHYGWDGFQRLEACQWNVLHAGKIYINTVGAVNGLRVVPGATEDYQIATTGFTIADGTITSEFMIQQNTGVEELSVGIVFRYADSDNYLAAVVSCEPVATPDDAVPATLQLVQLNAGTRTILTSEPVDITLNQYFTIAVGIRDQVILVELYRDERLAQLAYENDGYTNNAQIGVIFGHPGTDDYRCHISNFVATNAENSTTEIQKFTIHHFVNEITLSVSGGPTIYDLFDGEAVQIGAHTADTGENWIVQSGTANIIQSSGRKLLQVATSPTNPEAIITIDPDTTLTDYRLATVTNIASNQTISCVIFKYQDQDNFVYAFAARSSVNSINGYRVGLGRRINGVDTIIDAGKPITASGYSGEQIVIRVDAIGNRFMAIGGTNVLASSVAAACNITQNSYLSSMPRMAFDGDTGPDGTSGVLLADLTADGPRVWYSSNFLDSQHYIRLERVADRYVNTARVTTVAPTPSPVIYGGGISYTNTGVSDGWIEADVRYLDDDNSSGKHTVKAGIAFRVLSDDNYWMAYYYEGPGESLYYLSSDDGNVCDSGSNSQNDALLELLEDQYIQLLLRTDGPNSVPATPPIIENGLIPYMFDNFTDTDSTALTSHTSDSGHTWQLVDSSGTATTSIQGNKAKLTHPGTGTTHENTYILSSNDYQQVYAYMFVNGVSGFAGFVLRYSTPNNYMYAGINFDTNRMEIWKVEGGVSTLLESGIIAAGFPVDPDTRWPIVLIDNGSGITVSSNYTIGTFTTFNSQSKRFGSILRVTDADTFIQIDDVAFFTPVTIEYDAKLLKRERSQAPQIYPVEDAFFATVAAWTKDLTFELLTDGVFEVVFNGGYVNAPAIEARLRILILSEDCTRIAGTDWSSPITTYGEYNFSLTIDGLAERASNAVSMVVELQAKRTGGDGNSYIYINRFGEVASTVNAPWAASPGFDIDYIKEVRVSRVVDGVETIMESESANGMSGLCSIRVEMDGPDISAKFEIPSYLNTTLSVTPNDTAPDFETETNHGFVLEGIDLFTEDYNESRLTFPPVITRLLFSTDADQPMGDGLGLMVSPVRTSHSDPSLTTSGNFDEFLVFSKDGDLAVVTTDVINRSGGQFDIQTPLTEMLPWLAGDGNQSGNNQENIITSSYSIGSLIDSANITFRRSAAMIDMPLIVAEALNVPETGPISVEMLQVGGLFDTIQRIRIRAAGGSFRIRVIINGDTKITDPIPWNTTAEILDQRLTDVAGATTDDISVTGTWPGFIITFDALLDVKDEMVILSGNLVCNPFDIGPVPGPPYPYDLSPLPGDEPADPELPGPIPDDANVFHQTTFERHLFDPNQKTSTNSLRTLADIVRDRGYSTSDYTPYLRSCDTSRLTEVSYSTEISTQESYVLVENTIDSQYERARILEYLRTHREILPSRFVWGCWEP